MEQLQQLMKDIVVEQEEKRKSELDALQSQINPHFLYNTLDSIVWMIEGERYEDAVFMITQLASLFRISLSRGRTIISVEDEIKHARNYMNIQKIRYKNIFTVDFQIEEEILSYCTVKLIVQPLLENAIYYVVPSSGQLSISSPYGLLMLILIIVIGGAVYEMLDAGKEEKPYTVSVILEDSNNDRWIAMRQGLEQAAQDHNINLNYVFSGEFDDAG
ncbi:sensor histidine kinase BtsS [Muribaculaceae bacterium]|nr:sensor histidine kinase BtsS [Muribaculaceae bacterium]